jgi:hypothetical protein
VAAHRHARPVGLIDHEPGDAVLGRRLARGHAGPDHRRERNVAQRLDRPRRAALAEARQVRHQALVGQGIDDLPIGPVDAYHDGARFDLAAARARITPAQREHGSQKQGVE